MDNLITIDELVNAYCEEKGIILWKDVPGYEGYYQVSNVGGKVKNYKTGIELKPQKITNGYLKVTLCKEGEKRQHTVHKLVSKAWVPNPFGYTEINHINECKISNNAANLEWCDHLYNSNFGTVKERNSIKQGYPVLQFTIDGVLVAEYNSTRQAAQKNNLSQARIYGCCAGWSGYKTVGGFIWRYKE